MTPPQRRLLVCFAHPDDESFGPGGSLARYAAEGVQVHLVCATGGEAGTVDPEYLAGFESISELRKAELDCAVETLGLAQLHLLGYRDSGMPGTRDNRHPRALVSAPTHHVAAQLVSIMRQVRPQVVITFDPIGGYFHPDHIAIHEATVQAFHQFSGVAEHPDEHGRYRPQKLYFHTFSRRSLRWLVRLMPLFGRDPRRWGRNRDIDLTELTDHEYPAHARIRLGEHLRTKHAAIRCHASQLGQDQSLAARLSGLIRRLGASTESFTRGFPPPPTGLREHDLFAGVEEVESVANDGAAGGRS